MMWVKIPLQATKNQELFRCEESDICLPLGHLCIPVTRGLAQSGCSVSADE